MGVWKYRMGIRKYGNIRVWGVWERTNCKLQSFWYLGVWINNSRNLWTYFAAKMNGSSPFSFEINSYFVSPKYLIWRHMTSMANINDELMPFIRMTYPADKDTLFCQSKTLVFGEPIFLSAILLFGFIPMDLHWLILDYLIDGECFYENSVTLLHKYWKHQRILTEVGDGKVQLKDKVEFQPRIWGLGYLLLPVVKYVFQHRHKKLAKLFLVNWLY